VALPELQDSIVSHTAHGVTYRMWRSPDKIGRHFAAGTPYESPMLEWIWQWGEKQPMEPDPTVVALDVGANIGNHTLWMAKVCGFKVHAFEPVMPHVVSANADLNGLLGDPVHVWAVGLGAEQAEYHHTAKGVLKPGKSRESTDEVLIVVKLDDLVTAAYIDHVDLMKIDVEGMELDVLRGGLTTIERDRPVILTEEWEMSTTNAIQRLIGRFGYKRVHGFGGKGKAPVGVWSVMK
jgi:FkbM family methyltransferase